MFQDTAEPASRPVCGDGVRDKRRKRLSPSLLFGGLAIAITMGCQRGEAVPAAARVPLDASQVQPRGERIILGVATHFGIGGQWGYDPDASLRAIDRLGFESIRDDLPWSAFDSERPANGLPVRLGLFVPRAAASGIRPLLIVGHGSPAVEGGLPPVTSPGQDAFAGFAGRAANVTGKLNPIYEIWNEWNMVDGIAAAMRDGAGDRVQRRSAANYVPLALKGSKVVRDAQPNATILVGATGMDPGWSWATAVLRAGAMKYADGFSIHLYNQCEADVTKRTATDVIDQAEDFQRKAKAVVGATVPVYVTEVGWPTAPQSNCPISKEVSANNIAQFLLWSAATPWLKGVWIYQLKDQGQSPANFEDNFGILDYDYADKPAACAVKAVTEIIRSTQGWAMRRPMDDVFLLTSKGRNGTRLIAWTSRPEIRAQFTQEGGKPSTFRPLCAGKATSALSIPLGPTPVVIDLGSAPAAFGKVTVQ